jgi:hypothetical protein
MPLSHLFICLGLILIGVGFNLLVKLATLEEQGRIISPWAYVSQHPYRSLLLAVSAVLTALLLYFVDQLNFATAVLIGVAADMAADKMRQRAEARLSEAYDAVGQQSGT